MYILVLLYSIKTLDPSIRRGLIDSSLETFINVPFDVAENEGRVPNFQHIHTEQEFYAWTRSVLIKAIYHNNVDPASKAHSYDLFNRVLWGVRFRQIRMADQLTENGDGCEAGRLPPLIAATEIAGMACKYQYNDPTKVLEVDYGHPSTRLEQNSRGLPVNVTSEEWTWKPSTYDPGIIPLQSQLHSDYVYGKKKKMDILIF